MLRPARIAALLLLVAAPLAAQRQFIVTAFGGGADHLADLKSSPPAWFMPGYSVGASIGYGLTSSFSIQGDFTYTRNPVEGAAPLAGHDVNRFYYGVHAEYRYQLAHNAAPFVFGGLGAVTIDQLGVDNFSPTTRPALMYGGGIFFTVPQTPLEIVGEIKGLTYNWNMAGFHRNMVDVTYTAGLSYRFGL